MKKGSFFCFLVLFACFSLLLAAPGEPIAIIVNKDNGTENLQVGKLKRIYNGKFERWEDGQRFVVINRPIQSTIRSSFYKLIFNSKPSRKFFRPGSPIPFRPMVIKSGVATRKFVARIPNAIGYIYLREVDEMVKVLKIDGKLPREEGYRLK